MTTCRSKFEQIWCESASQRELVGAAIVGALCGLAAMVFSRAIRGAKQVQRTQPWWVLAAAGECHRGWFSRVE